MEVHLSSALVEVIHSYDLQFQHIRTFLSAGVLRVFMTTCRGCVIVMFYFINAKSMLLYHCQVAWH